jgi:pimeloyl-ACP methyl ester carboxylesterase
LLLRSALVLIGFAAASAPCGAQDPSREVSFQAQGYRLAGTLTRPDRRPSPAGVLIVPGAGPVDRDGYSKLDPKQPPIYKHWAERLAAAGFSVFRYDKRVLAHPGIDLAAHDQEAQVADAAAAFGVMRRNADLPSRRVFVIGHGEGGNIATVMAQRGPTVSGIAVVNSVQFPVDELVLAQLEAKPDLAEQVYRQFKQIRDGSFPKKGLLLGAGGAYWSQWMAWSGGAPGVLAKLQIPVLLVQSLADETLPGATLKRNVDAIRLAGVSNPNVEVQTLEGHNHLALRGREYSDKFIEVLVNWLRKAR